MCVVGGATTVGRCLALKRVMWHRFYLGPEYHAALINTLANVGNPKALFQSGLRRAVLGNTRGVIMPCLDQLRRVAETGHKKLMYALSLFLYRPNIGEADDDEARRLRLVEGPQEGATTLPWKKLTCTKRRSRIIASTWDYRLMDAIAESPVPICSVRVAGVTTTQDGMLGTRGVGSVVRSIGSETSVIGSSSHSRKR
jgi:hypothetical protein